MHARFEAALGMALTAEGPTGLTFDQPHAPCARVSELDAGASRRR
jgi:hypothetical protein